MEILIVLFFVIGAIIGVVWGMECAIKNHHMRVDF